MMMMMIKLIWFLLMLHKQLFDSTLVMVERGEMIQSKRFTKNDMNLIHNKINFLYKSGRMEGASGQENRRRIINIISKWKEYRCMWLLFLPFHIDINVIFRMALNNCSAIYRVMFTCVW